MPTAKQVLVFHSACMGVVAGVMAGTVAATTMLPSMVTNLLGVQDLKKKVFLMDLPYSYLFFSVQCQVGFGDWWLWWCWP